MTNQSAPLPQVVIRNSEGSVITRSHEPDSTPKSPNSLKRSSECRKEQARGFGWLKNRQGRIFIAATPCVRANAKQKQLPPKLPGADWRASQAEAEAEPVTRRPAPIAITAPVMANAKRHAAK